MKKNKVTDENKRIQLSIFDLYPELPSAPVENNNKKFLGMAVNWHTFNSLDKEFEKCVADYENKLLQTQGKTVDETTKADEPATVNSDWLAELKISLD